MSNWMDRGNEAELKLKMCDYIIDNRGHCTFTQCPECHLYDVKKCFCSLMPSGEFNIKEKYENAINYKKNKGVTL